jgi:hypothetical protein
MQIFSRQTLVLALMLSIGCVASGPSSAVEIYKYIDSNGRVHLTDRPPHNGYQLIQKAGKKLRMPRINFRDNDPNRKRFASKIAEVASRYQVPETLRQQDCRGRESIPGSGSAENRDRSNYDEINLSRFSGKLTDTRHPGKYSMETCRFRSLPGEVRVLPGPREQRPECPQKS